MVKMDSNTIFTLADFRPFEKLGNDKRFLDSGKKLNLGEGILHKCKFHVNFVLIIFHMLSLMMY